MILPNDILLPKDPNLSTVMPPIEVREKISNSPMEHVAYFLSPLETLIESLDDDEYDRISLHDRIEAYNSFSARVKSQIHTILQAEQDLPALNAIKDYSNRIVHVLRRDISCALTVPLCNSRRSSNVGTSMSPMDQMGNDDIEITQSLSLICRHALRFLSNVVAFPPLYSLFSSNDLSLLIDDVLSIIRAPTLPTLNGRKTRTLAIWILQVQRLPSTLFYSKHRELAFALNHAISGYFSKDGKPESISDGLKALHNLIQSQPAQFIPAISDTVPAILSHLISDSFDIRLQAALVLGGFVRAKMGISNVDSPFEAISDHIRSFIDVQASKAKSAPSIQSSFPYILSTALAVSNTSHAGQGPSWALSVLACLTVLLDSSLFSHPRFLKLLLPSLAQARVHKRSGIRATHSYVWKCIVWAFTRISLERCHSQVGGADAVIEMRERAFLVVKQELREGIGTALTASLLGLPDSESGANVAKAITVVQEMICGGNKVIRDVGTALLNRLLSSIGSSTPSPKTSLWDPTKVLALPLFDGTIFRSTWNSLSKSVDSSDSLSIDHVRQLSETEITGNWDVLISIWVCGVEKTLDETLSDGLIHSWQSLLLVQAQLTQGNDHLTTTTSILYDRIASTMSSFLLPTKDPSSQLRQLLLIDKLWTVVTNVFAPNCLSILAESLLAAVLRQDYDLFDDKIKEAWSKLCAGLFSFSTSIVTMFEIICVERGNQGQDVIKCQLWSVLAKNWKATVNQATWEDVVSFLLLPVGAWHMSDQEIELWGGILRLAVSEAGTRGVKPTTVIECLVRELQDEKVQWLTACPKILQEILGHVDVTDADSIPIEVLAIIDNILYSLYPPSPEYLSTTLQLLHRLREVVLSSPLSLVVAVLVALQKSLCCWIADESKILLGDEYNEVIMPLYCDSLDKLRYLEPSSEMLTSLSPFFMAAFVHIPFPALGPIAFQAFWKAKYQGLEQFYSSYPPKLKICLRAFDDAYGADLAADLSHDTESIITSGSIVPDSQPSREIQINSKDYEADESRLRFLDTTRFEDSRWNDLSPVREEHSPVPRTSSRTVAPQPQLKALQQLQLYGSGANSDSRSDVLLGNHIPRKGVSGVDILDTPENKESAETVDSHSPEDKPEGHGRPKRVARKAGGRERKRRKMEPEENRLKAKASRTISERSVCSPAAASTRLTSRPAVKLRFDGIELPTFKQILARERNEVKHRRRMQQSPVPRFSGTRTPQGTAQSPLSSPENYDSWEAALSIEDMRHLQDDDSGHSAPPDTQIEDYYPHFDSVRGSPSPMGTEILDELYAPDSQPTLPPARLRERSQTAPESVVPTHARPLRRSNTTSARLNALQQAYAVVADDASQIPVQDLVHATRLVHEIGSVLSEQMRRRLLAEAESRTL